MIPVYDAEEYFSSIEKYYGVDHNYIVKVFSENTIQEGEVTTDYTCRLLTFARNVAEAIAISVRVSHYIGYNTGVFETKQQDHLSLAYLHFSQLVDTLGEDVVSVLIDAIKTQIFQKGSTPESKTPDNAADGGKKKGGKSRRKKCSSNVDIVNPLPQVVVTNYGFKVDDLSKADLESYKAWIVPSSNKK